MRAPISVRMGMFCRLGESLERRPVAAARLLSVLWMRPSSAMSFTQPVYIGALELGQLAVLDDPVGYGVLHGELLQNLGVRRVAGLGLADRRNAHLLEEDLAELLRGADVEGVADLLVDVLLQLLDTLL